MPTPEFVTKKADYVRGRLDQLARFAYNPMAQEALREANVHPVRGLVIRAVIATPGLPTFLYQYTQSAQYSRAGLDVLGVGYHAITVADGDTAVRKLYRTTADLSDDEKQRRMEQWSAKQALALEHLEDYTVPQVFSIDEHPLDPTQSLIVASQRRIRGSRAVSMFKKESIPRSAHDFLQRSHAMTLLDDRAAPDLLGHRNVIIDAASGHVQLVDPIALIERDPEDTYGYGHVAAFLDQYTQS